MNVVCFTGRLVRDPELRTTSTGKSVASGSIAVPKQFKPKNSEEPDADFFNFVAWESQAEYLTNYGEKGRKVEITGRMENRDYVDKDGNKRYVSEVIVSNLSFLDYQEEGGGQGGGNRGGGGNNRGGNNRNSGGGGGGNNRGGGGNRSSGGGGGAPAPDEYDPFADE